MKVNFSVQFDKNLHRDIKKNAESIPLDMTDYVRLTMANEIKKETVLNHLKKIA
jgi:hypothetical protein